MTGNLGRAVVGALLVGLCGGELLSADEWRSRYELAAKENRAAVRPAENEGFGGVRWANYWTSAAEEAALRDLAATPADERLKSLAAMLDAAEKGENPPLEFAAHAIAGADDKLRDRIVEEILRPRYQRLRADDPAAAPLFRVFIAVERTHVEPGLTLAILKDLFAQPVPKEDLRTANRAYDLVASIAARTPEAERDAVLTYLVAKSERDFLLPIYRETLHKNERLGWEGGIRTLVRSVVARDRANDTLLTKLKKAFEPDADDRALLEGLRYAGFRAALIPEPKRDWIAKLVAALIRTPPPDWVQLAGKISKLEITADERFSLALALRKHNNPGLGEFACSRLLEKTPPEHYVELARRYPELAPDPKKWQRFSAPEWFAELPEQEAQKLVGEWLPQLPAKAFLAGPVVMLAEKLPAAERAELHAQVLELCLKKDRKDATLGAAVLEAFARSADVKPKVVAALIEREYGSDLKVLLRSVPDEPGRRLGRALIKVDPEFRSVWFKRLIAAVQEERLGTAPLPRYVVSAVTELAATLPPEQRDSAIQTLITAIIKEKRTTWQSVVALIDPLPDAERTVWIKRCLEFAAPYQHGIVAGWGVAGEDTSTARYLHDSIPLDRRWEVFEHGLERLEANGAAHDWRLAFLDGLVRTMPPTEDARISQAVGKSLARDPQGVVAGLWVTVGIYRRLEPEIAGPMAVHMAKQLFARPEQTVDDVKRLTSGVDRLLLQLSPAERDEVAREAFAAVDRRLAQPAPSAAADKERRESCGLLIKWFDHTEQALSADCMERLTTLAFFLLADPDPTTIRNYQTILHFIRGEFSPGFAPRKMRELLDRKPDGPVTPEALIRRGRELAWFTAHAPPQDVDACLKILTDLSRDKLARDEKFPQRTLSEAIAECVRHKSVDEASPYLQRFTEEMIDPHNWSANRAIGAALEPLARRDPSAAVARLRTAKSIGYLETFVSDAIDRADRATLYAAIRAQVQANATAAEIDRHDSFLFRQARRLTLAERFACLESFADGPRLDPKLIPFLMEYHQLHLLRAEGLATLRAKLQSPDCVGLRRQMITAVIPHLEAAGRK